MRYDRLTVVLLLAFVGSQGTLAATSRVTAAPAAPAALHEAGLATPSIRSTAHGQLPPDILLDSYLLRAEEAVRQRDHAAARAAMERIAALQEAHVLETVAEYHYRYASVWNGVGAWERSLASAVRYLELTGRDGNHYSDALTLMNRATAAIEEIRESPRVASRGGSPSTCGGGEGTSREGAGAARGFRRNRADGVRVNSTWAVSHGLLCSWVPTSFIVGGPNNSSWCDCLA